MNEELNEGSPSIPPTAERILDSASLPPRVSKTGQRIAEASWIACGLSILIGFFARMANPQSEGAIRAIAMSNDLLIVVGFLCGLIAVIGNRWWKNPDITRPAMTGLLLSIALVFLTGRARMENARKREETQNQQKTEYLKAMAQQELQAFLKAGWFAFYPAEGAALTLRSLPPEAASTGLLKDSGVDAAILSISVQNAGKTDLTLDVAGAVLTSEDGSQQAGMDTREVLGALKNNRDELMRVFAPPLHVPPGKTGSAIVFLPPSTDWRRASNFAVKINGASHVIPGRFLTDEEKLQLVQNASQPATQPK